MIPIVEFTAALPELTDHRRSAQVAVSSVCPVNVPLMGLWVVQAQTQTFDMTFRISDL